MSAAHPVAGAGLRWDQSDLSNTVNDDQLTTAPWLSLFYLHNVRNRLQVHTACLQLHSYFFSVAKYYTIGTFRQAIRLLKGMLQTC